MSPRSSVAHMAAELRELTPILRADYVRVLEAVLRRFQGQRNLHSGIREQWVILDGTDGEAANVRFEPVDQRLVIDAMKYESKSWQWDLVSEIRDRHRCVGLICGNVVRTWPGSRSPGLARPDSSVDVYLTHEQRRRYHDDLVFNLIFATQGRPFRPIRFEPQFVELVGNTAASGRVPPRQDFSGYRTTCYAVDLQKVRSTLGSGDRALLAELSSRFATELDEISAVLGDASAADRLLEHLVMGGLFEARADPGYDYCLEILCAALGERLSTGTPLPSARFDSSPDQVAAERECLSLYRVDVDLDQALNSDLGLTLPPHSGPRQFGGVLRADIPPLLHALEPLPDKLSMSVAMLIELSRVRVILGRLRSVAGSGKDLVCFPY